MANRTKKKPGWSALKAKLTQFDSPALFDLIHDLYEANKENQVFLRARFSLDEDRLAPYKATIRRWLCPDFMKNQNVSLSKARKAVSDYKKASGRPEELAELAVFYCECCKDFLDECGMEDESYFHSLVSMFEQALKTIRNLAPDLQEDFVERLEDVRTQSHDWGWGVNEQMHDLMGLYGSYEE